jgi:hypothetical protein
LLSPFTSHVRGSAQLALDGAVGSGSLLPSAANSGVSTPTAYQGFRSSFEALPITNSCLDLLQHGKLAAGGSGKRSSRGSAPGGGSSATNDQQQQGAVTPRSGGAASLAAAAAANTAAAAANAAAAAAARLGHSASWGALRAAEARAAALSGIKAMPDRPLALLQQLVELMKILVDQLREKCLEENKDANAAAAAASGAGGAPNQVAAGATGSKGSAGSSSSAYSSLTTAPEEWRLDEAKPCSGERLLLMFDRWE